VQYIWNSQHLLKGEQVRDVRGRGRGKSVEGRHDKENTLTEILSLYNDTLMPSK
jgi:hypothetical protein